MKAKTISLLSKPKATVKKLKPKSRSSVSKKTKLDYQSTLNLLKKNYPDAHCALNYTNAFELLIATILSAQCTDERVNKVTAELFKKIKTPQQMAALSQEQIEDYIKSTGFYKNKAKNIKACCEILIQKYHSQIPKSLDELVQLPGVGRKTANVVLGNAFNIASGVVVDTHVTRLANRFKWVKTEDAVKIEAELNKVFDKSEWVMLSHYLISHGRALCKARNPDCQNCFLSKSCPSSLIPLS